MATADERDALAEIDAEDAWSPAEFETSTCVDLDGVELLRLVRQELALLNVDDHEASAGTELGRRLLCAVAARLNARDWEDTLPVTDDFVVYATDLELVDLDRNLAECLPPDRLGQLPGRDPG